MSYQNASHTALSALGALVLSAISVALLLVLFAVPAGAQEVIAQPADGCQATVQYVRTDFPANAQRLGQHGTVRVRVVINGAGRASNAVVGLSSGYPELDQAAVASVRKHWLFDIAGCSASELTREHTVDVRFERAKTVTVSTTLDRKSLARSRELAASGTCQVERIDSETKIFACANPPLEQRAKVQQAAR